MVIIPLAKLKRITPFLRPDVSEAERTYGDSLRITRNFFIILLLKDKSVDSYIEIYFILLFTKFRNKQTLMTKAYVNDIIRLKINTVL